MIFSFFTTPLYIQMYFLKKLMVVALLCGKSIFCYDFSIARSDIFESTTLAKISSRHLNLHDSYSFASDFHFNQSVQYP